MLVLALLAACIGPFPEAPPPHDDPDHDWDGDGLTEHDGDCDDTDPLSGPEQAPLWFADLDGDGFGAAVASQRACVAPADHVDNDEDCDDARADVAPGLDELCDALDNDCDGEVDEEPLDVSSWHPDDDGDGFGSDTQVTVACDGPDGWVEAGDDCDDERADVHPGADERCDDDAVDEDCDGAANEPDAVDADTWYPDADGDGWASDDATGVTRCEAEGYASRTGDCDDERPDVSPDAAELCDPDDVDEDCDGAADDADDPPPNASAFWPDADGDGYGAGAAVSACDAPVGHADRDGDCDDALATVHPGAVESCDGTDEDCSGVADDGVPPSAMVTWHRDADGDDHGATDDTALACVAPDGYVEAGGDCDDADDQTFPGADEGCDGVDRDCDGEVQEPGGSEACAVESCRALHEAVSSAPSGTYWVDPGGEGAFPAHCDMDTKAGGWTLVLARAVDDCCGEGCTAPDVEETSLPLAPTDANAAIEGARWRRLRDVSTEALASGASTDAGCVESEIAVVATLASLEGARCTPLADELTAPVLAWDETDATCALDPAAASLWFATGAGGIGLARQSDAPFYTAGPPSVEATRLSLYVR